MNDSIDDVLHRYFDDVARDDRLGDTPVRLVMRRGQRRRARRRTGAMAGTLVVGALGSVVAVRTLSGGNGAGRSVSIGSDGSGGSGGGTPNPVPTDGAAQLAPSPLVWNEVTVGSAEAIAVGPQQIVADPAGGFYALSTEPGRSDGTVSETKLYHSDDGTAWEVTDGQLPVSRYSGLSASSGRLYAVGTISATTPVAEEFDPGTVVLAESSDGGLSWDDQPLPLDVGAVRTLPGVRAVNVNGSIGAGERGAVVAAVSRATLDWSGLTPAGVDPNSMDWWTDPAGAIERDLVPCDVPGASASTVPGVVTETTSVGTISEGTADTSTTTTTYTSPVVPESCTEFGPEVRRYSWEELGVPPESVRASRGALHVFFAGDGTNFVEQPLPPTPDGWNVSGARAVASKTQYVVVVQLSRPTSDGNGESRTIAYLSEDGMTWTSSEIPVGIGLATAGVLADDSIAVAGYGYLGQATMAVLRDGVWQSTDLAALDLGDDVLASMGTQVAIGPRGVAVIAYAGRPVEATPSDTSVPASSSPETLSPTETVVGPMAIDGTGRGVEYSTVRPVLLFSQDGATWSSTDLGELKGDVEGYFGNVTVTDDAVVVQHVPTTDTAGDPNAPLPDQTMFVGTLA